MHISCYRDNGEVSSKDGSRFKGVLVKMLNPTEPAYRREVRGIRITTEYPVSSGRMTLRMLSHEDVPSSRVSFGSVAERVYSKSNKDFESLFVENGNHKGTKMKTDGTEPLLWDTQLNHGTHLQEMNVFRKSRKRLRRTSRDFARAIGVVDFPKITGSCPTNLIPDIYS